MADFKTINDFRKGKVNRPYDDPTYLSFFFLFDFYNREESPLLSGAARDYLTDVVGGEEGERRARRLDDFITILRRLNSEMPWFWQSLSGLEGVREYGDMKDPYWAEKKLDITCLETIELTVSGMMDLYRAAVYDFNRWVEVIPRNLRHFSMYVYVTEIRTIQQTIESRNLNQKGKNTSNLAGRSSDNTKMINQTITGDAKPFFKIKLSFCEFDKNSGNSILSDLSKIAPEMASQTISISFEGVEEADSLYGNSFNLLSNNEGDQRLTIDAGDEVKDLLGDARSGLSERVTDYIDGQIRGISRNLGLSSPEMGNVHGSVFGGAVNNIINSAAENFTAQIFLDNVHGVNVAGSIQDAINTASINGIFNLINQQPTGSNIASTGDITPKNINTTSEPEEPLQSSNIHASTPGRATGPISPDNARR